MSLRPSSRYPASSYLIAYDVHVASTLDEGPKCQLAVVVALVSQYLLVPEQIEVLILQGMVHFVQQRQLVILAGLLVPGLVPVITDEVEDALLVIIESRQMGTLMAGDLSPCLGTG